MVDAAEEFIAHYGVKGMKWGVRGRSNRVTKISSDHKKVAPLRGRPTHELTNKQLKTANERLGLERQYKQLNPSKIEKGHNRVKAVLGVVGTVGTVLTLSQTPAGKLAMDAGRKFIKK